MASKAVDSQCRSLTRRSLRKTYLHASVSTQTAETLAISNERGCGAGGSLDALGPGAARSGLDKWLRDARGDFCELSSAIRPSRDGQLTDGS